MKGKVIPISALADSILEEATKAEHVKVAEAKAIRVASLPPKGEIATLMHKLAEDLRSAPSEITYTELHQHLARGVA